MSERPSEVGRRYAQMLAAKTATTPADLEAATPAATVLGGFNATDDDLPPIQPLRPQPPPEPATETELDQLRYEVRCALHELHLDEGRLAALHEARERAHAKYHAATQAVREAETVLCEVRQQSRAALVQAYVNGEPVNAAMTEADALARLAIRRDQLRHASEIATVLRDETVLIENGLTEHHHRVKLAAGALVSRSLEFFALMQRIRAAFATLRDIRLTVAEMRRLVMLDDRLCARWIDADEPSQGARYGGYDSDEQLLST